MRSEREIREQIRCMEEVEHLIVDDIQRLIHDNFKAGLEWVVSRRNLDDIGGEFEI